MNPESPKPEVTAVVPAGPSLPVAKIPETYFRGVPPDDKLNRMYGFARAIQGAAFLSPLVRDDVASIFYMVAMGEDLGVQWTHATRSIYPIKRKGKDGEPDQIRPGIQGDLALALLQSRKFKVKFKESSDEIATVWIARPDETMEFEDSFTIGEAQRLGLLNKPNWSYKKDMLRWRAVMRVARVVAADVLGGMYLPEELEESFGVSTANGEREINPYFVGEKTESTRSAEPVAQSAQNREPQAPSAQPGRAEAGSSGSTAVAHATRGGPSEPPSSPSGSDASAQVRGNDETSRTSGTNEPAPQPKGDRNDNAGSKDASEGKGTPGLEAEHEPSRSGAQAGRDGHGAQRDAATAGVPASETPSRPENITTQQTATVNTAHSSGATGAGAGTAEAAAPPRPKIVPIRMADAADKIAALLPDKKQRDKVLNQFLSGFFNLTNVKSIPKSDPRLVPALALLSEIASKYMPQLMADPHGSGLLATAGWRGLEKFMDMHAWPEDCRNLARAIARERYADSGGGDLLEWLQDPAQVEQLPKPELRVFLRVLARTREALRLREMASDQRSMCEIVESWGLDLQTCPEAEIVSRLSRADVHALEEQVDDLFDFVRGAPED